MDLCCGNCIEFDSVHMTWMRVNTGKGIAKRVSLQESLYSGVRARTVTGKTTKKCEVQMPKLTIDCLQTTNTEIECVVNKIRDYKAGLEIKEHELVGVQEKNARIIQNFRKLIEG